MRLEAEASSRFWAEEEHGCLCCRETSSPPIRGSLSQRVHLVLDPYILVFTWFLIIWERTPAPQKRNRM